MSNLLNRKSLFDLPKKGQAGVDLGLFTGNGPGAGFYDRDAEQGNPTQSPFDKPDHLAELLTNKISSNRDGGTGNSYLADVGGTTFPSALRPLDFDLEANPLYPNYNDQFGNPGPNSTYQNRFLSVDPQAKF